MCNTAIQVKNLAKRYTRGQNTSLQASLYETIASRLSRKTALQTKHSNPYFWALKNLNFQVSRGESIGIIGHNGAGKSTLLKILSRITDPTEGEIKIAGRVASLLEVGTGFHPELTGRENIFLNGTILGMTRNEVKSRLDQIIEFSGVQDALDTPVKRYSSGMRVRLAFAVAAHLDPEILIVDEVLAVGDMNFQKKCLGKMQEASNQHKRTVLFVSHNMSAVQTLCNRCIWLEDGQIKMIGNTTEVIDQYLSTNTNIDRTNTTNNQRKGSYGDAIRIKAIKPLTTHRTGFYLNEPLRLQITFESKLAFKNLRFGVTVMDLSGGAVMTSLTPTNMQATPHAESTYNITIDHHHLAPGMYNIGISIGHGSIHEARTNFDIINDGPIITVLPITESGRTLYNWQRAYGYTVNFSASCNKQTDNNKKVA